MQLEGITVLINVEMDIVIREIKDFVKRLQVVDQDSGWTHI